MNIDQEKWMRKSRSGGNYLIQKTVSNDADFSYNLAGPVVPSVAPGPAESKKCSNRLRPDYINFAYPFRRVATGIGGANGPGDIVT